MKKPETSAQLLYAMVEMGPLAKLIVNSQLMWLFHKFFGVSRLLDLVKVKVDDAKIIELGCGVGITTAFIASKFRKVNIVALDYESQIRVANKRGSIKNVKFVAGDATNSQFKNNSFDIAFEVFAFHHIPDYERAIEETYRVLKRGGRFYVLDFALKSLYKLPLGKLIAGFEPVHFTKEGFIRSLKKKGFSIKQDKGKISFMLEAQKLN